MRGPLLGTNWGRSGGRSRRATVNSYLSALPANVIFARASSANQFNSSGVDQTVGTDVARIDTNPATLAARGLLIEGARTNLLLQSNAFDDAYWTASNASVTSQADAKFGTSYTLTADATAGVAHFVYRNGNVTGLSAGSLTCCVSVYAKQGTGRYLGISGKRSGNGAFDKTCLFDLQNGTVAVSGALMTASVTPVGGGWYRCVATNAASSADATRNGFTLYVSTSASTTIYNGAGETVLIANAQAEADATLNVPFASSYIPTTSSTATRAKDLAASSIVLPTEFTFVTECEFFGLNTAANQIVIQLDDGTENNVVAMGLANGASFSGSVITAGSPVAALTAAGTPALGTIYKLGITVRANNFSFCVNGGTVVNDASGAVPTGLVNLRLGRNSANGAAGFDWLRRTQYSAAVTDAQLQALTA